MTSFCFSNLSDALPRHLWEICDEAKGEGGSVEGQSILGYCM